MMTSCHVASSAHRRVEQWSSCVVRGIREGRLSGAPPREVPFAGHRIGGECVLVSEGLIEVE